MSPRYLLTCVFIATCFAGSASASSILPLTSPTTANGQLGQPFSYQITADVSPTSFTAFNLDYFKGLTLNAKTGLISGTPTTGGTLNITLTATGPGGKAQSDVMFVIPKNVVPYTGPNLATGALGTAFSFQLTSTNVTTPLYGAVNGLPPGLMLDFHSGKISGTPQMGGVFATNIRIENGTTTSLGELSITITGGTGAPTGLNVFSNWATVGVPYFGACVAMGAAPITFTATPLPAGITIPSDNLLSGTPTTPGVTLVKITATNSAGSTFKVIPFTIMTATGAPAVSSKLEMVVMAGDFFEYKCDAVGTAPLSFTVDKTKLPKALTFDMGKISGVPFEPGTFNIPITATNAIGTDTQTLVLTVLPMVVGNSRGGLKFTDSFKQKFVTLKSDGESDTFLVTFATYSYAAVIDTPGLTPAMFNEDLTIHITIGEFQYSADLREAPEFGGKLTPGKSAVFVFNGFDARDRKIKVGGLVVTLGKDQVKIVASNKGSDISSDPINLRADAFEGLNQTVDEMIPVKVEVGDYVMSMYVRCTGTAVTKKVTKTIDGETDDYDVSTITLKGGGQASQ